MELVAAAQRPTKGANHWHSFTCSAQDLLYIYVFIFQQLYQQKICTEVFKIIFIQLDLIYIP